MPTLHDVTDKTKATLKWGGILFVAITLLFLLYKGAVYVKEMYFPTPRVAPTVLFGKLPPLPFEKQTKQQLSYVIDTVTGKLPTFTDEQKKPRDRMKVYKSSHNELSLLDLQTSKNLLQQAGFMGNGIKIQDNTYRFVRPDTLPKTIDFDIVSKNFNLSSRFSYNEEVLAAANFPDRIEAVAETSSFLQKLQAYPSDIDEKKTKAQLLKLKNGTLFAPENLSDSQIIRVDYFQKNLDSFPIYYPKGIYSTMNFLIASAPKSNSAIVQAEFYHQQITNDFATYPLKQVDKAYEELTNGGGFIAANFVKDSTIKIQDIFLGYFASDTNQDFILPIYVFKGREDEFYAYVSAVDDSWIKQTTTFPAPSTGK